MMHIVGPWPPPGYTYLPRSPSKENKPWEKWFAWYPVRINKRVYWFTTVYRLPYLYTAGWSNRGPYTYGTIFDVVKDA